MSAQPRDVLSSIWDGLSPHLIASFYEVKKSGRGWVRTDACDPHVIKAALTDASMEIVLNWQSPFEQTGPESNAPALTAMLQSGALQPFVDALLGTNTAQEKTNEFLSRFEGRAGITKLNSTQVFAGMPPVKIQCSALFRAWRDPNREVEQPVDKLMEWALPVELSMDGSMLERAIRWGKGQISGIEALMPSRAPVQIAMQYKNRTFSPLVIESIGMPLGSPVNRNGRFVELAVPLTLCTLTALDRKDWANAKTVSL